MVNRIDNEVNTWASFVENRSVSPSHVQLFACVAMSGIEYGDSQESFYQAAKLFFEGDVQAAISACIGGFFVATGSPVVSIEMLPMTEEGLRVVFNEGKTCPLHHIIQLSPKEGGPSVGVINPYHESGKHWRAHITKVIDEEKDLSIKNRMRSIYDYVYALMEDESE